jgi:uncharacterized protein (DUF362 family)
MQMLPKVAIKKCDEYRDETVYTTVKESVELLSNRPFFKRGERVLLKPNLLLAKPADAAVTTHPAILKAAIRIVKEAGAIPVVGDSPGIGSAIKVAVKCGVAEVCEEMGVEVVNFKDSITALNPRGKWFKKFEIARDAIEVNAVLNLPKIKTHANMFLTLGIKNLFGCVVGKRKPKWHLSAGIETSSFARMLIDLHSLIRPRLTIVDGIVGMEGNGPGNGDPRKLGLILASSDCIALDTVITNILGGNIEDIPILKVAKADGCGETDIDRINVLGESLKNCVVKNFKFPHKIVNVNFAASLPSFIERRVRKSLVSRPRINHRVCTLCNICVGVCPVNIINEQKRIEIDVNSCISCFCCQEMCPHGAIDAKSGWLGRLIS